MLTQVKFVCAFLLLEGVRDRFHRSFCFLFLTVVTKMVMFGRTQNGFTAQSSVASQQLANHEQNILKRSAYARAKLEGIPRLPFNAENHKDRYIPKVHQPHQVGDPQSVPIGFACNGAPVAKPVYGKKKQPVGTSNDFFIGGILVPAIDTKSVASTPSDGQWTGRKKPAAEPLPPSVRSGRSRNGEEEDAFPDKPIPSPPRVPQPPSESGEGATTARKDSTYTRWTAQMWGHGGGGYAPNQRKSLAQEAR